MEETLEKPGLAVAETYGGHMVVVNASASTLKGVEVVYQSGSADKVKISESDLRSGASVGTSISPRSGHNDYWSVRYTVGDKVKYRDDKRCNMPNSNNLTTVIALYEDAFSVLTPDDGPCIWNYVDTK